MHTPLIDNSSNPMIKSKVEIMGDKDQNHTWWNAQLHVGLHRYKEACMHNLCLYIHHQESMYVISLEM